MMGARKVRKGESKVAKVAKAKDPTEPTEPTEPTAKVMEATDTMKAVAGRTIKESALRTKQMDRPQGRHGKTLTMEKIRGKSQILGRSHRMDGDTRKMRAKHSSSAKEAPQPQSAPRGVPPVPLGANGRSAHETHGHTHDPSNLRGAESFDISTPRSEEKTWFKYTDPANKRIWLWNSETDEHFYEDAAQHHGWNQYASDSGNWWHHDDMGRWFFDPKLAT
eukprot:symbB.v1.2.038711.t1/scaffold6133.1/size21828/2